MRNKKKVLLIGIMFVLVAIIGGVMFVKYQHNNRQNYKQLEGIVVDTEPSIMIYTVDTQAGYEIIAVRTNDESIVEVPVFNIGQSIHILYKDEIADLWPPFLYANKITLNNEPLAEKVNEAMRFYENFLENN